MLTRSCTAALAASGACIALAAADPAPAGSLTNLTVPHSSATEPAQRPNDAARGASPTGGIEGFFEDFEQTGPFPGWGENTMTGGSLAAVPALPGQAGPNTAFRVQGQGHASPAQGRLRFPMSLEESRVLTAAGGSIHLSLAIYSSSLDDFITLDPIGQGALATRMAWGACTEQAPGECADAGLPVGALPALMILDTEAGSQTGQFEQALYEAGPNAGQPVAVPVAQWFGVEFELTEDLNTIVSFDAFNGDGPVVIHRLNFTNEGVLSQISLLVAGTESHYIDNVRAVGPTFGCPGDANFDDYTDFLDLNAVLGAFGDAGSRIVGDTNIDGTVNFADLNATLTSFGCAP